VALAIFGALAIGISLGLLGSGGSILTVPVLIFLLNRPEKPAFAESLAIVGCVALVGSIPYILRHQVHWNSILFFGLPGMLGAYIGGHGSYYISGPIQLTIFACIMLIVAVTMIFGPSSFEKWIPSKQPIWLTILEGFLVGGLACLIGIGGGFLIVPALVILTNLSMSLAIGTSLIIITMNSLVGFIEQLMVLNALNLSISWKIIGIISITGIVGSFAGSWIGKRVPQIYLRKIFGLSILVLGFYILLREL
jgi:uncharacterized membrane protein YfcA